MKSLACLAIAAACLAIAFAEGSAPAAAGTDERFYNINLEDNRISLTYSEYAIMLGVITVLGLLFLIVLVPLLFGGDGGQETGYSSVSAYDDAYDPYSFAKRTLAAATPIVERLQMQWDKLKTQ